MIEKKNIDQLFFEKLKDYEKDPPVFIWNNIENEIGSPKSKLNILAFASVAAALIIVMLSGWWMIDRNDQRQQKLASTESAKPWQGKSEQNGSAQSEFDHSASSATRPLLAYNKSIKTEGEESFPVNSKKDLPGEEISEIKLIDKLAGLLSLTERDNNAVELKIRNFGEKQESYNYANGADNLTKWRIDIKAGPVITGGIKSSESLITHADKTISAGVIAGYNFSKRVSVRSGLVLNQIKQHSEFAFINPSEQSSRIITPSGIVNYKQAANSSYASPALEQKLTYLSIPVSANYKIIDKKTTLGINAGISADVLVENKTTMADNQISINAKTADLRKVVLSGDVGLEIGYEISKRITLTIEPHLKHCFNSLSSNSAIDFKPIQAGLITGIAYSFN